MTTYERWADYFPPTPSPPSETETLADSTDMSSFKDSTNLMPNAAAPPNNESTKVEGAPNRMSLKLSHLPSKKDIKAPWPRTPSSVCRVCYHRPFRFTRLYYWPPICAFSRI